MITNTNTNTNTNILFSYHAPNERTTPQYEAIATRQDVPRLLEMAKTEAQKARWALCGIVAIVDAATHPKPAPSATP